MAKALKVAALVAGVAGLAIVTGGAGLFAFAGVGSSIGAGIVAAGAIVGVSAGTLLAVSAGLGAAAALLTKPPGVTESQTGRLTATIDPRAFRKEVFGSTAMATDVRYEEYHGSKQDYCSWIVCVASHACTSIDQIWLNDELAWTAAGGAQGKFAGFFSVPHLALEARATDNYTFATGKWNGAHRLTGCCWLHLQFKLTKNGKTESPFSGGPTSRMTIIGKGAPLYDPRHDSTVPGGSGPMRFDDQSTWAWSIGGVELGENLPLQILRRLIGWRIRNPETGQLKLALGSGLPRKRIDLGSFIVAANLADEQVARSAGGTEPRYHGAGVVSEGDDPSTVISMLCGGCCGRFRDTGGKLSLVIAHNDLAEAALDDGLTETDVIGAFTYDPDPSPEATPNIVRGRYVDPSSASLYQLIDYPEIRIDSIDGIDRVFSLDLGIVESPSQAQRIGKQVLQRKQLTRSFRAPFDERAWRWPVGKVVPFTFAPLGFDRQLCRVAAQDICDEGPNRGACMMELTLEYQATYAWDASDAAPVVAIATNSYDPAKDPIKQALAALDATALQIAIRNSFIVEATSGIAVIAATADGNVTIANHTRRYTDGDVAVQGATIATGLPANTAVSIAYDDAGRSGGIVAFVAYQDDADAFADANHPARHYVGYVTIPATGTSTGGGGGAGGGREGACVVDTSMFLLANADRSDEGLRLPASSVVVGDWAWTQHEVTRAWGAYQVTDISFLDADVFGAEGLPDATGDHQFDRDGWWTKAKTIGQPAGRARVAKITVDSARTYVTVEADGTRVLNHNIKSEQQLPND